jgi:predicted RecA/RadA family phage recombinase
MKNKQFFTGLTALLLAIGLVLAGCDNGSTDSPLPTTPQPTAAEKAAALAATLGGATKAAVTSTTVTLIDNVTIASGTTVTVPSGVSLTVDNHTLTVAGTLSVAGIFTAVHRTGTHVKITGSVVAKSTGTIDNQRRSDAWFADTGTDDNTNITYEAGSTAKSWSSGGDVTLQMFGTGDDLANYEAGGYAIFRWNSTSGSVIVKPGTPQKQTIDHASITLRRVTNVGDWHLTDGSQLTLQADTGSTGISPPQGALWFVDASTLTGTGSAKLILDRGAASSAFSGYISRRVVVGITDKDTAFQNLFKLSGGTTAARAVADTSVGQTTNYQVRLDMDNTTDANFTWVTNHWVADLTAFNNS